MGARRAVVERHLTGEELRVEIKKADDSNVVRRLCFVTNLYAGETVAEAARRVGASQGTASGWLARWNEEGPTGLIPRFGGAPPPKLTHQQSRDLQRLLEESQPWTNHEITQLIETKFGVSFHPGHVRRILRSVYGMSYAIPRPETPSRPENAHENAPDDDSREETADPGETIVGFFRSGVADADGQYTSYVGVRHTANCQEYATGEDRRCRLLRTQRRECPPLSRESP